ncbi:unnamed protein product [Paramecium primaurelia]|uniref:UvrD-like helicase ATP-binding domain-containing protein n=1 Tax=Paramecium primaurelia TaxID=5886 RepID=A0A8S1NEA7_PARPR|nr:unnamed protein product [Paramecium primaurelia]
MKAENVSEKKQKLLEEEQRLITLGQEFYAQYDFESINFITYFIPHYFEYYINSQQRDKQGNWLPLKLVSNSPIKKMLVRFDLNLLFPERIWEFTMTPTFLQQLSQDQGLSKNLPQILYLMKSILKGDFEINHQHSQEFSNQHIYRFAKIELYRHTLPHTQIYQVYNQFNSYEAIILQIIPKQIENYNSKSKNSNLWYVDTMVFITYNNNQKHNHLNDYLDEQLEDPFIQNDLSIIYEIKQSIQSKDRIINQNLNLPRKFVLYNFQVDQYVFHKKFQRWIKQIYIHNYQIRIQTKTQLQSQFHLLKKYLFTPNFEQYKNLLKNIKNEKFTINIEQFQAISQEGDTILIGRSGTGKTTISLLKLFITDAIFMLRQNLDYFKECNSKINMQYNQQLQNGIQLKTLFLTSSPLLAQQIKQKYENMVKNVEENLRQKNRIQKISEQEKCNLDDSTVQILDLLGEQDENESQFEIQDEDEEDVDQFEKEMGQFQTIQDIKQFPAFLTIRKLLFLLDSQLQNPFFKKTEQIHRSAQWHNEYFGVLSLNQNVTNNLTEKLDSEFNDLDSKEIIYHNNKMKEVTLECFKEFFWPKIIQELTWYQKQSISSLDPIIIWSEIITIIKGNETSYQYPNFHLNLKEYMKRYNFQSQSQPNEVFQIFLIYEKLKSQYDYYDILDLINHINYQQVYCNDIIEYMHYIILDELQDVPKALLILLNRITQIQLFLAGDNAQNIVKGIGMKFLEIQSCLDRERTCNQSIRQNIAKTTLIKLSYNFRSSNQILQLGNTLINSIEILFPNQLDCLQKEKSNQQGPKPTIIQSCQNQDLLNYLLKQYRNKQSNVEFGSNSVIIVKDQDSKLKIPIELQNAIILTIYEAKGLEFDDVILFNFFTDINEDDNIWSEFQQLEIIKIKMDKHNWSTKSNQNFFLHHKNINEYEVELTKLQLREKHHNNKPKKKLIIFDQSLQNRLHIQKIWQELDLVEIIQETQLQQIQVQKFVLSFSIDNKSNWKKQGYRMLRQNNYEQAYKCFMLATEIELAKKCMAYNLATQATLNQNNISLFNQAAQIFEEINLLKRAASCYFSAKSYQKAMILYQQLNCKNEMAESAYFLGQYQLAGQLFSELGDIRRSIECFNKQRLWDASLDQLNKEQFSIEEKLMFLSMIIPKYFKSIIEDIEKQEQLEQQQEELNNHNSQSECFQVNESQIRQQNNKQIINIDDDSQSFQVVLDESLDHLSFYDPDDEWIKIDNKSLIKFIATSSIESQFSNVLLMNQPLNTPLLKSRSNIFIKNNVMVQICERFKQFQNEFKLLLEKQKSQSVLLSFRKQEEKEMDHMINFLYDLEKYDIECVYFVLDILEHFKNYKLCIYVCNQFKLSSHLGRYLISLASQYTPINKNKFKLENWIIGNNLKRKRLLDQSILAQLTFNNILESINPIYLQFKNEDILHSSNSFGIESYKSLIGLGYWRTIIYQLNYLNAIKLCQSFNNYYDLINLIQKIKEQRETKQLTDEEHYQLIKYNYFIQMEQCFLSNSSNKYNINIDESFEITIQCASQRKLTNKNLIQLINNSKLYQQNLSNKEKLKQIESIILCMLCCMGILKFEIDSYSLIIDLVFQQQYCINQLPFAHNKNNIIEALQFLFKFSFPIGDIMIDFSQFCIIHITSNLISNVNEQMMFIDIAYEYILIPFDTLGKLFKQYFCNFKSIVTLSQTIQIQEDQQEMKNIFNSLKQRLKYQYENILPHLTMNQKDQIDYYSKLIYGIKQKNPVNTVDDHETSILHFTKNDEMRIFHKWLLQTNIRFNIMDQQIKYHLKNECIILFEQGLNNEKQKHGFYILALNMLHLQDNIPFAIFTLLNMKEKEESEYYLKYLEFLECQHYDIIEDSYDCFINYSQYFEDKIYLDEWMNHLIRIGIKLLLAQEGIMQIQIPQKYQDIISYKQKFDQPLFKITKTDIILDFIEQIFYYIDTCNSETSLMKQKRGYANLFLMILHIHIIKITLMYLIHKIDVLFIKGYFEEKLITLQINQQVFNQNTQVIYQNCLNKWDGYFIEAEQIKKNGINLLKKWRQFKSQHKITQKLQNKQNPQVLRFYQFHKVQFKDIQSQYKDIQYESLIINIYNFQKELLKLRQNTLKGADLQFVNQILNNSTNILKEIKNGNIQQESFDELKLQYQSWRDNINNFEQNEQELLERNRQILKLKWQKVQAGVKVQCKFDSQLIQPVQEYLDEDSQD